MTDFLDTLGACVAAALILATVYVGLIAAGVAQ